MAPWPIQPSQNGFRPGRLWSLLDMHKQTAEELIQLGEEFAGWEHLYVFTDAEGPDDPGREFKPGEKEEIEKHLKKVLALCERLELLISAALIGPLVNDHPKTGREFALMKKAVITEIGQKLFLYVPSHRASYYGVDRVSAKAFLKFRRASHELRHAGNCYAADEPTAAVFHAMRAAEIAVRALANAMKVVFSGPVEMQEWQVILNAVTGKIRDIENQPKSHQKAEDLEFFAPAAAQLRFFKDGWRVPAAHAGEYFTETQAREAIDHVIALIEILKERLSEDSP